MTVRDERGRVIARLDLGWTEQRIGCEAQSAEWHGGRRGSPADLARDNRLTALGWRMVYVTWADVRDPRPFTNSLRDLHGSAA